MPRVSNIEILKKAEQPILSIQMKTKVRDLPELIGGSYRKMSAYLRENGECLSDVPFITYHSMALQSVEVEIGFPVSKTLPGTEDFKPGYIPEGNVVYCMYRGAYADMEPTYNEMTKWIEENGLKALGTSYEYFYNGLEYPENELLTKIVMPIE